MREQEDGGAEENDFSATSFRRIRVSTLQRVKLQNAEPLSGRARTSATLNFSLISFERTKHKKIRKKEGGDYPRNYLNLSASRQNRPGKFRRERE